MRTWASRSESNCSIATAPLRIGHAGAQPTRHEPARLIPIGDELRVERLLEGTWEPLCDVVLSPQDPVDLLAANWLISTHPASSFRHHLVVSRTQNDIRHLLVDTRLTIRRPNTAAEHRELTAEQLQESLVRDFDLPMNAEWQPLLREIADEGGTLDP
jgi:N-hydroxyarylamine O-acetyltransferase